MVNGVQIALSDNHVIIFIGPVFRHFFGAESLVLDFEQGAHPWIREHCCGRPKVKVFTGVLDLHVNDGSVMD
jgi:hypothetical protein